MSRVAAQEDFLAAMAHGSRARVHEAQGRTAIAELRARAADRPPAPRLALHAARFEVIAEVKLRSPAAGVLARATSAAVAQRAAEYAHAGAAAVSVLTEPSRFDGSMEHLAAAAERLAPLGVPVMRKDFLVDAYQVVEARVAGAGGVLVILRMLARAQLETLVTSAAELGLFVLLEAFDERDLEIAHEVVAQHHRAVPLLVGVNCRDLATLQVVPRRLVELARYLPTAVPRIAESGVGTPADARHAAEVGYQAALIGSAFMSAADPGALVREMLAAARAH